ncbi:hypothetical protein CSW66_23895 [Shigella boydii]|nr:hypothetical protein CBW45_23600 [Shigella flexneri]OXW85078.1 hypothetical protein CG424_23630 [Shigella boydii]PHU95394.1 hypothetical protein CSW66_23895 [Shigella boydii]
MTDFGGKTSIFSHPVYLFLREFSLQDSRGGSLRQHLARLGRKSLSFSKSVELHDKVIGHYLNIKHYQ